MPCTRCCAVESIAARSSRASWIASSSPKKLGNASSSETATTIATSQYRQVGIWYMRRGRAASDALQRALGQYLRNGGALDLDVHAVSDLQRQILLAELRDLAEDAAAGGDLG